MTAPVFVPAPPHLRIVAIIAAVLAVVQIAMGSLVMSGVSGLHTVHGYVGYALLLVMIVTALLAFLWRRVGGAFMHAAGLAVLVVVQIGLGEMDLKWVHIILGLITSAGIISLIAVLNKKKDAVPAA